MYETYENNKHFYEYDHNSYPQNNSEIMEFFHWSYSIDSDAKLLIFTTPQTYVFKKKDLYLK